MMYYASQKFVMVGVLDMGNILGIRPCFHHGLLKPYVWFWKISGEILKVGNGRKEKKKKN